MELLKDYYTPKELALLTGCTAQNIRQHINRGSLKAEKLNGVFIIHKSEAERFIKSKGAK